MGGWPSDQIQHHLVVSENRKEVECIVAGEWGDCITKSPVLLQSDGNDATAAEISLSSFLFPNQLSKQNNCVKDLRSVQTFQGPSSHFAFKKAQNSGFPLFQTDKIPGFFQYISTYISLFFKVTSEFF